MTGIEQGDPLQVELAQLGGVDLKSSRQLVTFIGMIGTFVTGTFGHDWGIAKNAQTIAYAAFALIALAHIIGQSIHHASVEKANGHVKEALIYSAQAAQQPVVVDSAPNIQGVVDPPVADPVVVDNSAAVGSDLPTVDTTTSAAPAATAPVLPTVGVVTA